MVLLHPGAQAVLRPPAAQVVEDLVHCAAVAAVALEQLLHILQVQVGHAPAGDPALADQLLHAVHRLLQGHAPPPVEQVQVQAVHPHPAQTVLTGPEDVPPARVVGVHLGHQEELIPVIAPDGPSQQLLGSAVAVHLRGVDEGDARLDARPQGPLLLGGAAAALPQIPGPHAQAGHLGPVVQGHIVHGLDTPFVSPPAAPRPGSGSAWRWR